MSFCAFWELFWIVGPFERCYAVRLFVASLFVLTALVLFVCIVCNLGLFVDAAWSALECTLRPGLQQHRRRSAHPQVRYTFVTSPLISVTPPESPSHLRYISALRERVYGCSPCIRVPVQYGIPKIRSYWRLGIPFTYIVDTLKLRSYWHHR
jgi:hypothetical protein